jgi:hypothetical protein
MDFRLSVVTALRIGNQAFDRKRSQGSGVRSVDTDMGKPGSFLLLQPFIISNVLSKASRAA